MPNNPNIETLETVVLEEAHKNYSKKSQRKGQALMNALRKHAPDWYEALTGTAHDCFYDDKKISETLAVIGFSSKSF